MCEFRDEILLNRERGRRLLLRKDFKDKAEVIGGQGQGRAFGQAG